MGKIKGRGNKEKWTKSNKDDADSESDVGDIFTDEISEFTDARNKIDLEGKNVDSEDEEEIFGLVDEDDNSDEEIGEWSKRLKQVKFQAKLEKKKALPDAPEKSWGNKRAAFYGSGVRRKPKQAESDEEDEWTLEQKEIEKLQQKLDEDIDEEDFLVPSLLQKSKAAEKKNELAVKRDMNVQEKEELKKKLHPEAEPLRVELNKCMEELDQLKGKKGWKIESRDTCFRLLAANIAFYLYLIESNQDCRGHPVVKRIVQWKKLAKMYEAIPIEEYDTESESTDTEHEDVSNVKRSNNAREISLDGTEPKHQRVTHDSSDDEDEVDVNEEEDVALPGELDNRPVTYEIEKNKPKVKTAPNNPRVKHREKFRKAKIRRRGKIREYRPAINKYHGEASGIRAGIVRSVRLH
uniref:Sas10 C-terminal domain-containing protein n=1 Tax=Arion vulgaris TaxID=1028688 RepID=A0A0B6Y7J4_9EUPU